LRILTCIGDATSPQTWSGTPFYFLKSAQRLGFLDGGWRLDPRQFPIRKLAWNAWRQLRYGEHGGFQYSNMFLRKLQTQTGPLPDGVEFISHFPLFPEVRKIEASFYIDATLSQNFYDYGLAQEGLVGNRTVAESLAREKDQYAAAKNIVCMSSWAARSVVEQYGISPHKVHVIPAGANVSTPPPPALSLYTRSFSPLRLGFIGKDWRRKNLLLVLEVAEILQDRGQETEVLAAGFSPADVPRHPRLHAFGYIDKQKYPDRFADFFRRCHFTCLLSSAEAFGLSNRESLVHGSPVLARNIGGIADTLPDGCGHLFPAEATAGDIADTIQREIREPERYYALRSRIAEQTHSFTWDAAVRKFMALWAGSIEFSYAKSSPLYT
jgi:glycosyltransferase involved in cell wall biosynthesis